MASIEAKDGKYPFFGTVFHPELRWQQQTTLIKNQTVAHMEVNKMFGDVFINKLAKQNPNKFESFDHA